jgi:hypothetical protein
MKLKQILIPIGVLLTLSSSLLASPSAEKLFDDKCAACHVKVKPADFSTLVAPPAMGVVRHVKMNYNDRDEAIKFIVDYTLNPQRDKSVCMPQTIQKFGLMPSQKANVTKEELEEIAEWMYDNINTNSCGPQGKSCGPQGKNKNSCGPKGKSCGPKGANKKQANNRQQMRNQQASPFLIASAGLPHYTKMVKMNWDNKELNLTQQQKKKLIVIRKATMGAIMSLKPQILELEKKIKILTMYGETPKTLHPMVQKLSQLKADATKVHIDCIYNTTQILKKEQLNFLTK